MVAFCQENGIPHEICGKLVVAADDERSAAAATICTSAATPNGLEGLRWLGREEMREIEPHVGGVAALRVPQEGIVDYPQGLRGAGRARCRRAAARVVTGARVTRLRPDVRRLDGADHRAATSRRISSSTAPGCIATASAELAGERREMRIVPFRGEYYKIRPERQSLVRNLIYPGARPAVSRSWASTSRG